MEHARQLDVAGEAGEAGYLLAAVETAHRPADGRTVGHVETPLARGHVCSAAPPRSYCEEPAGARDAGRQASRRQRGVHRPEAGPANHQRERDAEDEQVELEAFALLVA